MDKHENTNIDLETAIFKVKFHHFYSESNFIAIFYKNVILAILDLFPGSIVGYDDRSNEFR